MIRSELYIGGQLVDLKEDIPASLNYAIADIVSPEKRNTSYSKTIKVPGSKRNDILFGHIFEISKEINSSGSAVVNFSPDFNPNLKAPCTYLIDTLVQFKGIAQLLQVNINGDQKEYEIALFGNLRNIFVDIDSLKLTDIDLSEYDHAFTKSRQKESWDTKIQKNGADYVNFSSGNPTGEGYVYPVIDYGYRQNQNEFEVQHLFPAVYLKEYIDKMFKRVGFTYTSDFFNSTFFKRLIIPFSGEVVKLSQSQVDARKFLANTVDPVSTTIPITSQDRFSSGTYTNNLGGTFHSMLLYDDNPTIIDGLKFTNDSFGDAFDSSNIYNPTNGRFSPLKKGTYDLFFYFKGTVTVTVPSGMTLESTNMYLHMVVSAWRGGTLLGNGSGDYVLDTMNDLGGGVYEFPFDNYLSAPGIYMEPGDYAICFPQLNFTIFNLNTTSSQVNDSVTIDVDFDANGTKFFNVPVINPLLEGDTMLMNSAIPKEISLKDFFLSIIRMFNLYINIDPDNDSNLIIEPLVDFYSGNTVVDWTKKLDRNKTIEIKPVSEIEGRDYIFRYKQDKDFYNEDYEDKWGKTYGEKSYQVVNDFVKGQKIFELLFSPTPSVGNDFNLMVIPRIIKKDPNTFSISPYSANIRILYYGGVKNAGASWKYMSDLSGDSDETTYSYAGHLDDPYNPTIDLLFDLPEEIYFSGGATYTNNNLFNKYYRQFIEEITDKDSKLVTAYFNLKPIDIANLNFKNFPHVDGINFRLNKIIDYNPIGDVDQTTKVEIVKIKQGIPFTPSTVEVPTTNDPGNFDLIDGGEDTDNKFYDLIDGGENDNNPTIDIINGGKD